MKKKLFASANAAFAALSSLLPGNRKWFALAGGALLLTAAIVGSLWHSNGGYTALFGSQEDLPISQVITVLDGEKIAYRIDPSSGQILVPQAQLSGIRMTLAAKGVQAISPAGYELMDKDEVLGSSQFVQNIRYKRSLEGEMAQSIMSLDAVETARVHLALEEESAFVVSDKPQNSASVMVRLHYGSQLSREQVNAIIHLVSGSVPGLPPAQVSIVDQAGNLLSEGVVDGTNPLAGTHKANVLLSDIQNKTRASLANVLTTLVGKDNFRISVMPELDLSLVEETRERLGDTPKVNREQSTEDKSSERLAVGIPGSLSNRPPEATPAQAPEAGAQKTPDTLSARTESQRDYSYDRTVEHIQHPGFELKRLNVAVVLNQDATAVKAWKAEQTAQVTAMLNNAAGIDERRGDKLSLSLMQFVPEEKIVPPPVKWWQNDDILAWCRLGGIGLLLLLVLLLVVRPLVKHLIATRKAHAAMAGAAERSESSLPATLDDEERRGIELPSFSGDDALPAQSSGLETKLEFLKKLAISDTDRVADVIRQWITSNERIDSK
ncbi:flagellar basal body M-ring protein [Pseudescherichia vulneris NBRC 102420]|uniref:Flagellar M-ring protein n=1 Tax=Pseudescherichia vulneris NBRC 102420 TaxID=1115515 RepID=A0A090V1L3_PSEVU|nr:flagellar basal-body MS-ring/collar protein FliF [Pseudescherichia vulneris]GAL58706.1 flagellar basal body M-ring protein [Pseudescherichia vulneris NBRC 102420]STQ58811.1 lateral flagellar M-ring protein (FliF-like) [Pseudescherichia vulneris]